jgi:hypothetical protein
MVGGKCSSRVHANPQAKKGSNNESVDLAAMRAHRACWFPELPQKAAIGIWMRARPLRPNLSSPNESHRAPPSVGGLGPSYVVFLTIRATRR